MMDQRVIKRYRFVKNVLIKRQQYFVIVANFACVKIADMFTIVVKKMAGKGKKKKNLTKRRRKRLKKKLKLGGE